MRGNNEQNENHDGKPAKKQKHRKYRKPTEKEILAMYQQDEKDAMAMTYKSDIGYQQWSYKEKYKFDEKFMKPRNKHQEEYIAMLQNDAKKIIVVTGPAGTGKTAIAVEQMVRAFLIGKCNTLIFTRPSVSVDEDLGYLPGTLEDKMAPWIRPIYDVLYQFISPKEVEYLIEEKRIEIAPLGFMRGRTFKHTWIIADEMQNSTISQMKMLLTRLGENSRLVVTGDLEQYDRQGEVNGMEDFLSKFRGKRSASISSFEFARSDIQREPVVKEVLDIYSRETIPEEYQLIEE
jgi:phosphate starvation-inducible PhoH-like protein